MSHAVILAGLTPAAPLSWAVGSAAGLEAHGRAASFGEIPASVRDSETATLVLPGDQVATRALTLPLKRDSALEDAAALAFEDILAEPVEGMHFAFGPVGPDGRRLVSAVPRAWLEPFLDAASKAGIEPDAVTADHLVLAAEGHDGVILSGEQRVVAALPGGGMTVPRALFETISPALDTLDAPLRVSVGASPADVSGGTDRLVLADDRALGAFLLSSLEHRAPPSFLRGVFRRRRDWRAESRHLRLAAALLAASLAVWAGSLVVEAVRFGRGAAELRDAATVTFSEAFPGTPVVDLERQVAGQGASTGSSLDFLALSAALSTAIEEAGNVRMTALRYSADQGLVADLIFPSAGALEGLQADLESAGLETRESGTLRRDNAGAYIGQLSVGTLGARS